jgi:hypothetical protein
MKRACLLCLLQFSALAWSQSGSVLSTNRITNQAPAILAPISALHPDSRTQSKILGQYGNLSLSFEANHGQTDGRVKFLSRTGEYTLFLTADEAVLRMRDSAADKGTSKATRAVRASGTGATDPYGVLRMKLRNANRAAKISGVDELEVTSNYFMGNDPSKWQTDVPSYSKVKYEGIYSGVDLVYYGNQHQLEYDFVVAPGADPSLIAFDVRGAKRILSNADGDLIFKIGKDEIRWRKPVVYQEKDGLRQFVAARYAVTAVNRVKFELAKYDANKTLYIDPLIYSTYLGGSGADFGYGIAVDAAGNTYIVGETQSNNFPATSGAFQQDYSGSDGNAFVSKINPAGTALVYSTYLGGSVSDAGTGITVDASGNAYVVGTTTSADFPVTEGAFQTSYGGNGDAFVTELNPTGSALVYSTYLGGSEGDEGWGIALGSSGNVYVAGSTSSTDFPTKNPFQPVYGGGETDAFVTELNSAGSALVYSTYLGGSETDRGNGIAVDSVGDAYVIGYTNSTNFPTVNPLQPAYGGDYDAFVTKLNPAGSELVYSTYFGGSGADYGFGIAADSSGNAYVVGTTYSGDFPVTPGAFQTLCGSKCGKYGDAFVAKINSAGSAPAYSTYLGGSGNGDRGSSIAVDSASNAYVTGSAGEKFPTTPNAFQRHLGGKATDAFVTKFNATGSALFYSTYLGGSVGTFGCAIAIDSSNNAFVTGYTNSTDFPVTPGVFQPTFGGDFDVFVTEIPVLAATATTVMSSPNPSTAGQPVTFTAMVSSTVGPPPDGEAVSFMKGKTVLGTGTLSGGSASLTISTLKVGTTSVKAVYGGDSSFSGSTSKALKQVVDQAAN